MASTDEEQQAVDASEEVLGSLVATLSGRERKARQSSAHAISLIARQSPEKLAPHIDALVDAIDRGQLSPVFICRRCRIYMRY